jgi:bile acid-coenzyme A ligase
VTTLAQQLEAHAQRVPDAPAITCAQETATWRELVDGAARMAAHFEAAGATAGSLVTIGLPNSVAFVQAAVGAWWIGATPAPISNRLPAGERRAIIELAAPAVAVGVEAGDAAGRPVLSLEELGAEMPVSPATDRPPPCWKAITSGGSTGRPKLIVANQPGEVERVEPLAALLNVPTDITMVVPGPLSHNAPFAAMSVGLMLGNHVVLMPRFNASECLRLAEEHRAVWLYQVPTMMLRIWRLPEEERRGRDLSNLRVVFHMAAPCPPWLKREWIDWLGGDAILELYAGTELQAMTIVNGTEWVAHPGTVGRVMLGEMEIRDADGRPLPAGETGEIWMRRGPEEPSPYHYLGADARTATDNWESLGDNGHFDDDGYLYLADRSTDMIVVGGSNVYPAEIEAALDEHPAVRSSCVIGLPHEDLGSAPYALVELAEEASDEELIAWVRDRVAPYKVPKGVERVHEPLRDDAGKVRRSQLRAARLPA